MSSYRILSDTDLDRLPPLRWLVKGVLPAHSFSVLYGPSGIGKSFVALDLAYSVGLGNSWYSHEVVQGDVLYVSAGEGGYGLKYRRNAWRQFNATETENVSYGLEAVQLANAAHVKQFLRAIDEPDLIILDTLARCAVGVDENSVDGMGQVVQGIDTIREETGAAVMVVHHSGKPDKEGRSTYRGSTALEAAADTMIEVAKDSKGRLLLNCHKQKEAREFYPIRFKLETVALAKGESAVAVPR